METAKHNEKAIKKAIKKAGLEQPSPDFMTRVMQKIETSDKITAYKPLISRKGWLAIAATALIFMICAFYFKNDAGLAAWLKLEKRSAYFTFDISENISFSKNTMYGILLTVAVILLQIPILKSWHNKSMWKNHYQ